MTVKDEIVAMLDYLGQDICQSKKARQVLSNKSVHPLATFDKRTGLLEILCKTESKSYENQNLDLTSDDGVALLEDLHKSLIAKCRQKELELYVDSKMSAANMPWAKKY
jgi:hypothetical protein